MTETIAFLTAVEGVERVELTEPWEAVVAAGFAAKLLCPARGPVQLFDHLDKASTQDADDMVAGASVDDYVALVLPGGVANPDALRLDGDAVSFVKQFIASGKPVAAICHAPWTLIEAGAVSGKRVTSWPSLKTDLLNAGADWVDEAVVVDGSLITSRKPADVPAFTRALLDSLADVT